MTAPPTRDLVRDLRLRGVVFDAAGNRLQVDAPKGIVTSETKDMLRTLKPDLLRTLDREREFLGMSIEEFEKQDSAIEVRVPWLSETLWFVPRIEHIEILVREAVRRGRIWTAAELTDLLSIPGLGSNEIERIGRLKAEFGAEILSVTPEVREAGNA